MGFDLTRVINNGKLSITFLRIKEFSNEKLENFVDSIQVEMEKESSQIEDSKGVIQHFNYKSQKREYELSFIINIPKRITKSYYIGSKHIKDIFFSEITRNIEVIVQIQKDLCIVFSKSYEDVVGFRKYIRKLTHNNFNVGYMNFNIDNIKSIVNNFKKIQFLKVFNSKEFEYISFKSKDLMKDKYVVNIINNKNFDILDIQGLYSISPDFNIDLNIKRNGRIILSGSPNLFTLNIIFSVIKNLNMIF